MSHMPIPYTYRPLSVKTVMGFRGADNLMHYHILMDSHGYDISLVVFRLFGTVTNFTPSI